MINVELFDDNCYYVNTMGLFIVIIAYIVKIIVKYLKNIIFMDEQIYVIWFHCIWRV